MKRIRLLAIVAFTSIGLVFAYSQTPQPGRETPQTNLNKQVSPEFLAKARGKKLLVTRLPAYIQELELKDGLLKIRDGYRVVRQPNGALRIAANNGSGGLTVRCHCLPDEHKCWDGFGHGCGECKETFDKESQTVYCDRDTCKSSCEMSASKGRQSTRIIMY